MKGGVRWKLHAYHAETCSEKDGVGDILRQAVAIEMDDPSVLVEVV